MTNAITTDLQSEKNKACPECGENDTYHFDPFNFGSLVDEHIDADVDESIISKRLADAMDMARRFGGRVPGEAEDELDQIVKPKLTWQDFARGIKAKKQQSAVKNDWSSPKRRALFSGLYVPKKIDYQIKFLCAIDTSG